MSSSSSSTNNRNSAKRPGDDGFTLIEILIAIVLVGILSAVAVVGISNLVSKGTASACSASRDAAKAASAVYFTSNANTYPLTFNQLTTVGTGGAALTLPSGATINSLASVSPAVPTGIAPGLQVTSGNWYLTMTVNSGAAPSFSCSP
jgi:prepilin-type N-terminal cleavage/methylation domain-containing protein